MLKIVYAENSEQFLWENSEQFYLMQNTDFMNAVSRIEYTVNIFVQRANLIIVETDFINAGKQIRSLWNLNMKKQSDLAFKFRKHNFTRCFMRKQRTIF